MADRVNKSGGMAEIMGMIAKWALLGTTGLLVLIMAGSLVTFFITFRSYNNKKEGISLFVPRTWAEKTDIGLPGAIVAFVSPKDNALDTFQENISITYTDLSAQPMDLPQYAELAKSQLIGTVKDLVATESMQVAIGGRPAWKFVFQGVGEAKMTLVVYAYLFNNVAYNITYAGRTERYNKMDKAIFEMSMATLKILF